MGTVDASHNLKRLHGVSWCPWVESLTNWNLSARGLGDESVEQEVDMSAPPQSDGTLVLR
jgi:hypothetical protein